MTFKAVLDGTDFSPLFLKLVTGEGFERCGKISVS